MIYTSYYDLGATLYVPATTKDLDLILTSKKYSNLRSVVVCFEDSILDSELEFALSNFKKAIVKVNKKHKDSKLKIFLRPRNDDMILSIISDFIIDRIHGYVLPKFNFKNEATYFSLLQPYAEKISIMPTLETDLVFDLDKVRYLLDEIIESSFHVLCIRIGSEDILNLLSLKRDCKETLYSFLPLYMVFSNILTECKLRNLHISSPVFADYNNKAILYKECELDVSHGVYTKTIIHPSQIDVVELNYSVTKEDYQAAKKLLDINYNKAVFSINNKMLEKNTHYNWANSIMKRYDKYGIKKDVNNNE